MKKLYFKNSICSLLTVLFVAILALITSVVFANELPTSETAHAQNFINAQTSADTTVGKGNQISVLNQENTITLEEDVDNWFYYNCSMSASYGFTIFYANVDLRDNLNFYAETNDEVSIDTNRTILPSITTGQGKSIVYNFTLVTGVTYNFNISFSDVGIDYLDTVLVLSQRNEFDKVKMNNDEIINQGSSQALYNLVAGQSYEINFSYVGMSSGSSSSNILYYDSVMKNIVTKNNAAITENEYGVNTDTSTGDIFTAKANYIDNIGTIYFVDCNQIYSIKFKVVEKPYTAQIDNVVAGDPYNLQLKIIDSYGIALENANIGQIVSQASVQIGDSLVTTFDSNYRVDINKLAFWGNSDTLNVNVNFSVPWYGGQTFTYNTSFIKTITTNVLSANANVGESSSRRIKLSNFASNKTITLSGKVESVVIQNCNVSNIILNINTQQDVTFFLDNVNMSTNNTSIIQSANNNLSIYLKGNNYLSGKILSDNYIVDAKTVKFLGNGYLNVTGSNGSDGATGTESSMTGANGEKGTNALKCTNAIGITNKITIRGGNGGNGGNGYSQTSANGLNGGNGANGGNAGKGITVGTSSSNNGYAGLGGNGGKGGDGVPGNQANIGSNYTGTDNINHVNYYQAYSINATVGGKGGNGGNAGNNGQGNLMVSSSSYPRGGDGGKGGNGGSGVSGEVLYSDSLYNGKTYSTAKANPANGGTGGNGGNGAHGGNGGRGGNGGSGYNGLSGTSDYLGGPGASGGSGGTKGTGSLSNGNSGSSGSGGGSGYDGEKPSCVAEGTLITLADGSQKAVELLTGNEQLLVWNLKTGAFDTAPILFIDSDPQQLYEVINLYFSDGTVVKVISEHGFWNIDLNKYVFLRNDAAQYLGHWFNKQITDANGNMTWVAVQLTNVVVANEVTTSWSPVTYEYLCYYVNGMLSMPGATTGLINIFEVDAETMQYDQELMLADIEEYGLFTYEEFAEILPVPQEIFDAFDAQYLKVAIGKGLVDWDTLASLIENYSKFFNA